MSSRLRSKSLGLGTSLNPSQRPAALSATRSGLWLRMRTQIRQRRNMTTTLTGINTTFEELKSLLTGHLILPEDPAYDQARQLWNEKVNKRPAALVRCASVQDVVHAVRWARSHGLALSVRGGGHDFAGRALCDDGIVVDCSQMRAVSVDPE